MLLNTGLTKNVINNMTDRLIQYYSKNVFKLTIPFSGHCSYYSVKSFDSAKSQYMLLLLKQNHSKISINGKNFW